MFKVGFDFHGVVQAYPTEFKNLFAQMKLDGAVIGLITGATKDQIHRELNEVGIEPTEFDFIHTIADYLIDKHNVEFVADSKGNLWTDEKTWWSSKGKICNDLKIDMLFDDSIEYGDNMPIGTNFILFNDELANLMFG